MCYTDRSTKSDSEEIIEELEWLNSENERLEEIAEDIKFYEKENEQLLEENEQLQEEVLEQKNLIKDYEATEYKLKLEFHQKEKAYQYALADAETKSKRLQESIKANRARLRSSSSEVKPKG